MSCSVINPILKLLLDHRGSTSSPKPSEEPFVDAQKTSSGIFLPSSATQSPLPEATVIAVGPGAPNKEGVVQPVSVTVGDRVLLPGWGGNAIKVGEDVRGVFLSFAIAAPWSLAATKRDKR